MSRKKRKKFENENTVRLDLKQMNHLSNEDILLGASSIIGTRETQQDAYHAAKNRDKNFAYAVLCDGMGGLEGGERASGVAVEYISQEFEKLSNQRISKEVLMGIVLKANIKVGMIQNENGEHFHGGTTLVAILIQNGMLYWCSVGDSKLYLFHEGRFQCLTNEHNYSFMAEQRKTDETFSFDSTVRKDALVSYLGAIELTYVDLNQTPFELSDGDMLLLCSDGLYKTLTEDEMVMQLMLEEYDMQKVADNLTGCVWEKMNASQDNTTVVVLKYKNE